MKRFLLIKRKNSARLNIIISLSTNPSDIRSISQPAPVLPCAAERAIVGVSGRLAISPSLSPPRSVSLTSQELSTVFCLIAAAGGCVCEQERFPFPSNLFSSVLPFNSFSFSFIFKTSNLFFVILVHSHLPFRLFFGWHGQSHYEPSYKKTFIA